MRLEIGWPKIRLIFHSSFFKALGMEKSLFSLRHYLLFMYAYLEGKFTYKNPALLYIDVNGVGYEVNISLNTYSDIQNQDGGRIYVYLQIREDAHVLYGFSQPREKEMFLMLTGVSGVGAATARMMLSSLRPDEIAAAIASSNARVLEAVKGIGKKTAERLVLELKDKVGKHISGTAIVQPIGNTLEQDALVALTALGISRQQAELSIHKIIRAEPSITQLEDLIKKALKAI
jgi:Holliday junction DNA helicase RuvA